MTDTEILDWIEHAEMIEIERSIDGTVDLMWLHHACMDACGSMAGLRDAVELAKKREEEWA